MGFTAARGGGGAAASRDPWGYPPVQRDPQSGRRPGILALIAVALAAGLLAGGIGGVTGWALADRQSDSQLTDNDAGLGTVPASGNLDRAPESVAGIAAQVLPSVANIEVRAQGQAGTGSGFVIREDGYVLTNNHVVAGGADGVGSLSFLDDEATYEAHIVGRSPEYDLAVLKIEPDEPLPVASLGNDDDVAVGDPVVAIGSPLGLAGTVTSGIISAKDRPVTAGAGGEGEVSYISALQTDAAVNPGNSGGRAGGCRRPRHRDQLLHRSAWRLPR